MGNVMVVCGVDTEEPRNDANPPNRPGHADDTKDSCSVPMCGLLPPLRTPMRGPHTTLRHLRFQLKPATSVKKLAMKPGNPSSFDSVFELGELIDTGSFGKVFVAIDRRTGTQYAVKLFRIDPKAPKPAKPGTEEDLDDGTIAAIAQEERMEGEELDDTLKDVLARAVAAEDDAPAQASRKESFDTQSLSDAATPANSSVASIDEPAAGDGLVSHESALSHSDEEGEEGEEEKMEEPMPPAAEEAQQAARGEEEPVPQAAGEEEPQTADEKEGEKEEPQAADEEEREKEEQQAVDEEARGQGEEEGEEERSSAWTENSATMEANRAAVEPTEPTEPTTAAAPQATPTAEAPVEPVDAPSAPAEGPQMRGGRQLQDDDEPSIEKLEDVYREITMLQSLSHANIISYIDFFENDSQVHLVTELVEGGRLFDSICENGRYAEADARTIVMGVLDALTCLHERRIIFRDLKPENVLLVGGSARNQIKLCDFGFATQLTDRDYATGKWYTPGFGAPELLSGLPYSFKADVYSLGVLTYVLLTGCIPWDEDTWNDEAKLDEAMVSGDAKFHPEDWDSVSKVGRDFVSWAMCTDSSHRASIADLWRHPFITQQSPGPMQRAMNNSRVLLCDEHRARPLFMTCRSVRG